ncbi:MULTISPECIES: acyl-CoA dehydrogenase family protein [unclassified Crossiella]|uniref:acyl-CoA dehydrogenase family protein n=1 Tax=unclassified Crossiella TaxID=2620835 RepID=UPI001FFE305A|nr:MULTISPECIES: acyl-CoA dehydrogenase family protein [unclassified Crossiella]MCK2238472.1 acyl-CoA dehydrogenase family protein [Crossiella sp. S99.2]MCK2251958.1 acyl-CoA dehydrogenase family protein [Crossiella sp. S99.1]
MTTEPDLLTGDFYGFQHLLDDREQDIVRRTREFLAAEVAPIANAAWATAEFPHEVVKGFAGLDIAGLAYRGERSLLTGFLAMELNRVDPSLATFFGVHSGLAMGSVNRCGSEEQKQRWLPAMARMEQIGAFALTEPEGGSDVSGGMRTTARREGDTWILNGAKRWIGNATFADLIVVWARDEADNKVKGFVVERGTPGFTATRIEHKVALRTVQNADITLTDCRVPEANRLQRATGFRDTADILRQTRGGVAWQAVGVMMGAYEKALAYATQREQFGRPIAGFQLVQDLLVRILANVTTSLALVVRLAQLQDEGVYRDEHSALAKAVCTVRMREAVGWAREILGGNGIVLDYDVARFVADAEAIYSYEGTREMNTLIVGRAITGHSAFV